MRRAAGPVEVFRYRRYTVGQYVAIFAVLPFFLFALTLLPGRYGGGQLIDDLGVRDALLFFVLPMCLLVAGVAVYTHRYTLRLFPQGIARGRLRIPWRSVTRIEEDLLRTPRFVRIHYVRGGRARSLRVMLPLRDPHGRSLVPCLRERWDAARATASRPHPASGRRGTTPRTTPEGVGPTPR